MLLEDKAAGLFFGAVTAVDAKTCRIRVSIDDRDNVQTHWIHVPQKNTHNNKHRSLPDLGAHVAILLAANGVDGIYEGSIYSDSEPPPVVDDSTEFVRFSDGSTFSYDNKENLWDINIVGDANVNVAKTANVKAGTSATIDTPETRITGNATIDKQLTVKGGLAVSGGSGAKVDGDFQLNGNLHSTGDIDADGDIKAAGESDNHHSH